MYGVKDYKEICDFWDVNMLEPLRFISTQSTNDADQILRLTRFQ